MKILFAGGGTAGHINPALAIAQQALAKNEDTEVLFVGNRDSMEHKLVCEAGFEIRFIKIQGFNRRALHKNLTTLRLLLGAVKEAEKIIRDFAPDVVVGTGGYVSGPVLFAATKLGLPTAIHEQNAFPGITTKILAKRVDRVFTSFEASHKYFKKQEKLKLVGNPLRRAFESVKRERARAELGLTEKDFFVLSFGGSLGATALNVAVLEELKLTKESGAFVRSHSYGKLGKNTLPAALQEIGIDVGKTDGTFRIAEFIYDMPRQIAAADAVVTRAGAITVSELTALGKAAVLVPSPNVTGNHQFHNANALAQKGAAILLEEKDLSGQKLYEILLSLKKNPAYCKAISEKAREMAKTEAASEIYTELVRLVKR